MKNNKDKSNKKCRDLVPKILSVLAAIVLWFYVVDEQNTVEEKAFYGIPVVVENFDASSGLTIVSGMDNTVDVVIKGAKSDISGLTEDDIYASVDMTDIVTAGEHHRDINISSPDGVTVISRTPRQLDVTVDKTSTRVLSVNVNITSYSISDEYEMGAPELEFTSVVVSGPERFVKSVAKAEVRLSLGEIRGNKTAKGLIVLIDNDGRDIASPYLKLDKTSVEVMVPVTKITKDDPPKQTDDNKGDDDKKNGEDPENTKNNQDEDENDVTAGSDGQENVEDTTETPEQDAVEPQENGENAENSENNG